MPVVLLHILMNKLLLYNGLLYLFPRLFLLEGLVNSDKLCDLGLSVEGLVLDRNPEWISYTVIPIRLMPQKILLLTSHS
jgi:hypothetical protein